MDAQSQIIVDGSSNNAGLTTGTAPIVELVRHDTASSTESVPRSSEGHLALNLSGNCPSCHHHHISVKVRVHVSGSSTEVDDVRCHKCRKLWLAFGKVNTTRLSLLSATSVELDTPEPEAEFRSALVQIIQAATPVATLSPTLTVITEVASAGPSRETSVRSTACSEVQRRSETTGNHPRPVPVEFNRGEETPGLRHIRSGRQQHAIFQKSTLSKGRQALSRFKSRLTARFRTLQASSSVTKSPTESSPNRNYHRQIHASSPTGMAPTVAVSESPEESREAHSDLENKSNQAAPDVCAQSANATDALDSLKALGPQTIQSLSSRERFEWGRRQLTDFRTLHARSTVSAGIPVMINSGTQADFSQDSLIPHPPFLRRHSALAFAGNIWEDHEYWDVFRGITQSFHNRPLSMSDTNFSDADTAVERISINPTTHQLFIDSLHRDRRGSGSSLPRSMHSIMNEWRRNRPEARLSIDSAATGGAVRSIAIGRTRANNRLSRTSMNRPSSVYGAEPTTSQVQLPVAEETEHADESGRVGSPSVSPPMPEMNVRSQS